MNEGEWKALEKAMDLSEMLELNVTDLDLDWRNRYQDFQDNLSALAGLVVFDLVCFTVGSICIVATIGFEKFSGDPQKRSLTNQVIVDKNDIQNCGFNILTLSVDNTNHTHRPCELHHLCYPEHLCTHCGRN